MVKVSLASTLNITVMVLMIFCGSGAFSQVLGFTGATFELVELVASLQLPPYYILSAMLIVLLIMGTFLEAMPIIMITLPIFIPIIQALGFDPIWFGAMMLLTIEMGLTTPPFGLILFVVRGLAPKGVTMMDVYKAGIPFLLCDLFVLVILFAFPQVALWLPGLMH